jgi:hypothetical protein
VDKLGKEAARGEEHHKATGTAETTFLEIDSA